MLSPSTFVLNTYVNSKIKCFFSCLDGMDSNSLFQDVGKIMNKMHMYAEYEHIRAFSQDVPGVPKQENSSHVSFFLLPLFH